MRKITRITTQKKHKDRYNIYLSDNDKEVYGFSVDEAILVEFNLHKGLELEDSFIKQLVEKDNIQKSYLLAINYLSYRMRTVREMKDYLKKKEVAEEHIPIVIDRLKREKLLDDKEFANMFVQTRLNTSSKGPLLIKKELMEKGVNEAIASLAVDYFPYDVQYDKVNSFVEKKLKLSKKESFTKQIQKIQGNLIQKGYSQDVIQEVLQDIQHRKNDEVEWEALVYQADKLLKKHRLRLEGYALQSKIKEGLYRKGFSMDVINRYLDELSE